MTILLLGSGRGARSAGGGSVPGPEASAFLARTSGLDATHTNAYTDLINGLVTDVIWSKLDALYIYATADSTTAMLNLVQNAYNLTQHGSPTFTTDRGFTGTDSSSTIYMDTGFNPSTATSPKFTQNDAHICAWQIPNAGSAAPPIGQNNGGPGDGNYVWPQNSGSGAGPIMVCNSHISIGDSHSTSDASGFYISTRDSSSSKQGYRNNATLVDSVGDSSRLLNCNIYTLGINEISTGSPVANGCGTQQAMAGFGSKMTSTDVSNFYNRLRTYMTAVGVP
ncbi:hypothetical protein AB7M17_006135 [Bradyrhizobium sp. USDA 377]